MEDAQTQVEDAEKVSCGKRCCRWLKGRTFKIYCQQALSSWGDRMWQFAVGLYLVTLDPNSLRLTAIYGLTSCLSLIIFGAPIGRWIDQTGRLNAAGISLFLQNTFVALCAVILVLSIWFDEYFNGIDPIFRDLKVWAIISVAVFADLASAACRISIGKDWIVVVSKDSKHLSYMNAMVRRIDLTSLICAPIVTGQIMTYMNKCIAAIFIAGWNIVSMFIEFAILSSIYRSTPALRVKQRPRRGSPFFKALSGETVVEATLVPERPTGNVLTNYCHSWKLYFKQKIVFAGLALAFLYMTVLGFDSITQGYAYQQGVSEAVLGGLSAVGAVVGILGTLAYPRLRSHIGIERTGLYGFFAEVSCLTLCVISVWMPGSPFQPTALCYKKGLLSNNSSSSSRDNLTAEKLMMLRSDNTRALRSIQEIESCKLVDSVNSSVPVQVKVKEEKLYTSIALLMTGIVTARFGLWMADLTINQLLQEDVPEEHRGAVNGVQHSLNMLMNMLKFILVVAFPCHETFGYLIITSFTFICMGWFSYCVYSYKMRGHINPFHKVRPPSDTETSGEQLN